MEIKAIKNDKDYKEALNYVEGLIDKGVDSNSVEAEKFEVITTLIQDYESKKFQETLPDPIDALEFVMEQRNLSQEELVPYIGSRSKVSEILARKRSLSLNMIRALHDGLGIPAKVLLNQFRPSKKSEFSINKFPIKEMLKRGYISTTNAFEEEISKLFSPIAGFQNVNALLNRTYYIRSPRPMNLNALQVWMAQVVKKSKEDKINIDFDKNSLTNDFLKKVVDLSDEDEAIHKVHKLLKSIGIILIAEPHMPQTYLDGAAIMIEDENPIIGITARHDRLDNFWFTLMHELAHIKLHYGDGTNLFYDDIESIESNDPKEKEADDLALSIMVPDESWVNSPASIIPSPDAAKLLANQLGIHPAIIAGKMRYERKHYHFLNSITGKGEVRKNFPEVNWLK